MARRGADTGRGAWYHMAHQASHSPRGRVAAGPMTDLFNLTQYCQLLLTSTVATKHITILVSLMFGEIMIKQ